ncbi:MAG TPA: hypothetical protein VIV35_07375, partial [Chitinophagaceae bacterium]
MSTSPFSVARFRVIFSISWLIIIINFIFLLRMYGLSWNEAIVDSLISNTLLLLACLLIMNTLRYYTPRRERYFHILVWLIFLTIAWSLLSHWLLSVSLSRFEGYAAFLKNSTPIRRGSGFLMMACFTLVAVLWFNWEDQRENDKRKQDAE